jgi:hypothetical protein
VAIAKCEVATTKKNVTGQCEIGDINSVIFNEKLAAGIGGIDGERENARARKS